MKAVHLAFNHRYDDIRIFEKECVSLAKHGYETVYITSSNNSPVWGRITQKGVKLIVIPVNAAEPFYMRLLKFWIRAYKEACRQNADVFHLHEVWFLPMISMLKRKGRVIYDSHEDAPRDHFERYKGRRTAGTVIAEKLFEKYENSRVRMTSGVIAATPYIANRFRKIHKNVVTVANYPIIDRFTERKEVPEENIIFYAGGISKMNGILNVIKAMEYIDGTFVLAGNMTEQFRTEASSCKGWEKVREAGFLSKEEVAGWYQRCSCGVLLYLPYENNLHAMPNKMFEYMAGGVPIVASNFSLWKKYVEGGKCGLCVNPESAKEIAEAINYIFKNPTEAERMSENGRRYAEHKFYWGGGAERILLKFYKGVKQKYR